MTSIPKKYISFLSDIEDQSIKIKRHFAIQPQAQRHKKYASESIFSKPKRIFDIGTGAGLFPFYLDSLGHTVTCSDISYNTFILTSLYKTARKCLNITDYMELEIIKQQSFKLKRKYDIITSLGGAFYAYWNKDDFLYFLKNCFSYIKKHGCIFLEMNTTGLAAEPFRIFKTITEYDMNWLDYNVVIVRRKNEN